MRSGIRAGLALCMAGMGWGVVQNTLAETPDTHRLAPLTVIGSKENIREIAGSGDFIDIGDIRQHSYDDINRVLRRVPGVYLREEDGFGLFPNISLRGVDTGRSTKITMMEDGVLTAPAPYAAPAAYYAPTVARMSGIEVLKGSSQIKYGPQTSGGVINYLSTPIPGEPTGYLRTQYGSEREIRNHANFGDTLDTEAGRVGYLIEYYDRRTEGFKTIDSAPDFTATGRTGFRKQEPMLKLMWEPKSDRYQRFELKLGYTEMVANEGYMGLTEEDFNADPFRRYAGSRFDRMSTRHARALLRHQIEFSPALRLTSSAYYNKFKRSWFKERITPGDIADPARVAVLKGEAAGVLRYRNNNREYYSAGLETIAEYDWSTDATEHTLEVGVRAHRDEVERFQRDDDFIQADNGAITDRVNGVPGGGGNRTQEAEALAVYAQDTMRLNNWRFIPGVRYERIDMKFTDRDTEGDPDRVIGRGSDTLDVVLPGIGVIYDVSEETSLFGGIHRGFSAPGPRAFVKDGIKEETSIGYELGARYNDRAGVNASLTLFYTDFEDLVVPDLVGAGGQAEGSVNAGDVRSYGAEMQVAVDPGRINDWGFSNPWYLAATYTHAELAGDTPSLDDESIFAGGEKGNRIPYIPEFQALIGTGLETARWGAFADVIYVDSAFATASETTSLLDPSGTPNAAFGKTDSYVIVELSGYIRLRDDVKLIGSVHNAFDEEYLVARHPAGPRPGKPLTALAGFEVTF